MNNHSDLSNAFGDNIEAAIRHYIVSGYAEGRTEITITATNNLTNDTNNSSQTTLNRI